MANIVESHCAAGRRQDAFRFLQEHRPRAIEPFEPLLVACVMGGDDTALRLATRIMREAGVTPTASTFGLLLSARLDCGDTARALKVCQGALAAGLAPPPENVRALVLALAEAGLSGSALELLAASVTVASCHTSDQTPRFTHCWRAPRGHTICRSNR